MCLTQWKALELQGDQHKAPIVRKCCLESKTEKKKLKQNNRPKTRHNKSESHVLKDIMNYVSEYLEAGGMDLDMVVKVVIRYNGIPRE